MKVKYYVSTVMAICLAALPTVVCKKNLRRSRHPSERRISDTKSSKQSLIQSGKVAKSRQKGKSTAIPTQKVSAAKHTAVPTPQSMAPAPLCGRYWHLSQTLQNPNSCTNDNNLPEDPTKLHTTVQECCKAEFGKIHGCNVYNACRSTPKPSPLPSTPSASCGSLWHRSLSLINPNSCTNDNNLPEDPKKLYLTVRDCCKAEFGKVHGCNVYNACRSTPKPSPLPSAPSASCGSLWHRSLSLINPDSCTNDNNLPEDPKKLYLTVRDCCKAEFGNVAGCNVYKVTCNPSHSPTARTGYPAPIPTVRTDRPAASPNTNNPTPATGTEESSPPTELSRSTLAYHLNEFYRSNNINVKKELRHLLNNSVVDASDLEDLISGSDHTSAIDDTSIVEQQSNQTFADTYAGMYESFVLDSSDSLKCTCVDCSEDTICGGLWNGIGHYDDDDANELDLRIHIVVSHCKSSLDWMTEFIKDFAIESIYVITKCGYPVVGAPDSATILTLPNVGRCDHTYAYYMANLLPRLVPDDEQNDSIVVFLKDDISNQNMHQKGQWSNLRSLANLAASDQGFSCGIRSMDVPFGQTHYPLSAFHQTKTLGGFTLDTYQRNQKGYDVDTTEFKSPYDNISSWWSSLGIAPEGVLTHVCYGGVFAASVANIRKKPDQLWKSLEINLSRGNNIQEGHYAERSWALLLSTPLLPFQERALIEHSDGVYINMSSTHGALLKIHKLFLHIGVKATSSTESLAESLIKYTPELKSDGYQVAVHGKYNPSEVDFPNIDRLGSCMWSDVIKQSFPHYLHEATICPEDLLPDLSRYMDKAAQYHRDLVILNPWLSRRGTADPLGLFFDPLWEVHTIIYYRRYFEWITLVFEDWRLEILEHTSSPDHMPYSSFRYVDFIREYCKRLFYGKDVRDDGYPIRNFDGTLPDRVFKNDSIAYHYDTTSNYRVEELTDLLEYTYFVAKEYSFHPRFRRHITIVNYHDDRSIETNFFCRVLRDAHNSCEAAVEDVLASHEHEETESVEFAQMNPDFPIRMLHIAEDLAIAAYKAGRLHVDNTVSSEDFPTQIRMWVRMIVTAFELSDMLINDLPIECLYEFEAERLLEVSLAYEKSLLPAFYDSPGGALGLIREFRKWQFCSIDTDQVLGNSKWDFLFDVA